MDFMHMMKKRPIKFMLAIFIISLIVSPLLNVASDQRVYGAPSFNDINGSYAKNEILELVKLGIISGYNNETFAPEKPITRAEFSKILSLSMGLEEQPHFDSPFTDVPVDSWYRGFVGALIKSGITNGTSATTFSPNKQLTREEMVVLFIRAFGLENKALNWVSDVNWSDSENISSWARAYIDYAYHIGFINGVKNDNGTLIFDPKLIADRQSAARLAYEFITNFNKYTEFTNNKNGSNIKPSPTTPPTLQPSSTPMTSPTLQPSSTPTTPPTLQPSSTPTTSPTLQPSSMPTTSPTTPPSPTPTMSPAPITELDIVKDNQSKSIIVIPNNSSNQMQNTASILSSYIKKATSAELSVISANQQPDPLDDYIYIYLGSPFAYLNKDVADQLEGLDRDGFVIHSESGKIIIAGNTDWGTEFGVYEFLERYLDISWLLPTEAGEYIPELNKVTIPIETSASEPAYFSRHLDNATFRDDAIQSKWARFNRQHARVEFAHNIFNLFPVSEYSESTKDFYPNGVKPSSSHSGWQVCYSNPDTIPVAINKIKAHFAANPDAESYSLGVNDGGGYCEENDPQYSSNKNVLGYVDMSNIYFSWVNAVVEGVREEYPDKYFGLYAYSHVYEPPTLENFQLNDHVVLYITDDRLSWGDPELEDEGKSITEQWGKVASNIGFYEYMYGSPYVLPRVYFNHYQNVLQFGQEYNVNAFFAELFPNWGEGPKPWVTMKLLWDPNQSVDELLDEWYTKAVGEEAASALRAYYEHWEHFWSVRLYDTDWYKFWAENPFRINYMRFNDAYYLAAIEPEEMVASRRWLEETVEKAGNDNQKVRAQKLLQAFEYYEASYYSYTKAGLTNMPMNKEEALAIISSNLLSIELADLRMSLINSFDTDPILKHRLLPQNWGLTWSGINGNSIAVIVQWIKQNPDERDEVIRLLEDLVMNSEFVRVRNFATMLLSLANGDEPINPNYDLEIEHPDAPGYPDRFMYWLEQNDPDELVLSSTYAFSGKYSVRGTGMTVGGPYQILSGLEPGQYVALAYYYTDAEVTGTIQYWANISVPGIDTQYLRGEKLAVSPTVGGWSIIPLFFEIPEFTATGNVEISHGLLLEGFGATDQIYIDDISIYKFD